MTADGRSRRNADLDPADGQHRADLFATITRFRRRRGITQRQAAHIMGAGIHTVTRFDQGLVRNPAVELVQRHCQTIGHVLGIALHDLPDVAGSPAVQVWHDLAARADRREDADRYDRTAMVAALVAARETLGVTQYEVSRRLAVYQSATCQFEREIRSALLGSYQRYARALGGHATFTLNPILIQKEQAA